MLICGIDPSLTSTGLALIRDGVPVQTWTISTVGRKSDDLRQRHRRLKTIAHAIVGPLVLARVDMVVIESPAYSKMLGHQHDRSGLWWLIVHGLMEAHVDVVEVPSTVRQKYATGKGNAAKDVVMIEAVKRYPAAKSHPAAEITCNDEADAMILAAIGSRVMGLPVEHSLPKTHLAAMDTLRTPVGCAAN